MNFKQWLLLTEAKKDINLSNLNLTTTIPPLNASVSNPNLTTTKISNRELGRELASNQKVKELAIEYIKAGGFAKLPFEFKNFLNAKKRTYREFRKGIKSNYIWYPSDIKIARHNGLPDNWMLFADLEKESNQKVKELAIEYIKAGGFAKLPLKFKYFLNDKRKAYKDYKKADGTKNSDSVWYPSDIEVAEKNGLPNNWIGPQMEILKSKNEQKSNDRLEELAIYYGKNGSGPSTHHSNKAIKDLGQWHNSKKSKNNSHEASDNKTWAEIVSKFPSRIDPDTQKPFLYPNLPKDWRNIRPSDEKSLGEKYVLNILTELGITNDTEYRDTACKNKRCLRFDFSITHNGKKYLEFHGGQHYVPTYFGSGEDKTKQEIAKDTLKQFEYIKGNDTIKYDHCVKENLPFLVIPYWLDKSSDIVKSTIIKFLKTNKFNETFADPDVPQNYKAYHDRMLKMTKCFAKGKANCKDLFKKQKTTFEQFLINKNFINI